MVDTWSNLMAMFVYYSLGRAGLVSYDGYSLGQSSPYYNLGMIQSIGKRFNTRA